MDILDNPPYVPTQPETDSGQPPLANFLSLREAAALVGRSEKTIRRLVGKGRIPHFQEKCPPYRLLVDLQILKDLVGEKASEPAPYHGPEPPGELGRKDDPAHPGHPAHPGQQVQPSPLLPEEVPSPPRAALSPPARPSHAPLDDGVPPQIVRYLSDEVDRLRAELSESRNRTRDELGEKELRINGLVEQLVAARTDAGKWQQAEQYRSQLYRDFMELQQKYMDTQVKLELLEHNPVRHPDTPPSLSRESFNPITAIEVDVSPQVSPPTAPGSPTATPARPSRPHRLLAGSLLLVLLLSLVWARLHGLI